MIEKILIEINRLKKKLDGYSAKEGLDYIESYINTLSKQQVEEPDKSLEEAAEKYSDKYCSDWAYRLEYEDAFQAGAEWQYQKDRGEFAKIKAKEWINGYDEGYAKGLNARKED